MPVLFSRVSTLLRWNHLQQPLAVGELGFLLMRSLAPQLHLTKPLFACASPGLCHRPWINIHTDFGVPYEQLAFHPSTHNIQQHQTPITASQFRKTTALSGSPLGPQVQEKSPNTRARADRASSSCFSALPVT